ncbi:DNA/RNA-binding winged helix domain-containing protein [Raoultella sp. Lac1]
MKSSILILKKYHNKNPLSPGHSSARLESSLSG